MKKWIVGMAVICIMVLLTSCNTVRGAGTDLRRGADGVENMLRR